MNRTVVRRASGDEKETAERNSPKYRTSIKPRAPNGREIRKIGERLLVTPRKRFMHQLHFDTEHTVHPYFTIVTLVFDVLVILFKGTCYTQANETAATFERMHCLNVPRKYRKYSKVETFTIKPFHAGEMTMKVTVALKKPNFCTKQIQILSIKRQSCLFFF